MCIYKEKEYESVEREKEVKRERLMSEVGGRWTSIFTACQNCGGRGTVCRTDIAYVILQVYTQVGGIPLHHFFSKNPLQNDRRQHDNRFEHSKTLCHLLPLTITLNKSSKHAKP